MTEALMLVIRSTAVFLCGMLASALARRSSAAVRHVIWVSTLALVLVLPFGFLIPERDLPTLLVLRVAGGVVSHSSQSPRGNLALWLTALWASGSAILLLRLVIAARQAVRLVRTASVVSSGVGFDIRESPTMTTPAAWGLVRPAILLPAGWKQWTPEQTDAAIRHEQAHLLRKDCYALLMAELACALYWFNPLVWYTAHRMRTEQEHATDDVVLGSAATAPADYAGCLLGIVRGKCCPPLLAGVGQSCTLSRRIEAILDQRRKRDMLTRRMTLTGLLAAVLIALPIAGMQAPRKVYKIGEDGVTAPKVVSKSEPKYTQEARDAKVEGTVLLSGIIESDGSMSGVRVLRSLDKGLDQNAVEEVLTWTFEPARKGSEPVPVSVNVEIHFRLL